MNKEELKQLIQLNRKFGGLLKLSYLPEESIKDEETTYNIYYGGHYSMEINQKYYNKNNYNIIEITDDNINEIVDDIYNELNKCIKKGLKKYMEFKEIDEDSFEFLKYFENDSDLDFEEFRTMVFKFRDEENKKWEKK
jgi:hypothetical protein